MLNYLQQLAERRRFGMKPGLQTIRALLERLGNPERAALVETGVSTHSRAKAAG